MYQHNFLKQEIANYLKLVLGEWKQIKFQFLSVYSWKILFIIKREMFLHSGENCNNSILYAVTKQNVHLYFLFKMSTVLKTSLWEHSLLYFVLYNADLFLSLSLSFFFISRLFNILIKTMGEKAIGQLAWVDLCCGQRCDYSSHTQIQNNHDLVGQNAVSHSMEPFNVTADKRLNSCFYFSLPSALLAPSHLSCLLLIGALYNHILVTVSHIGLSVCFANIICSHFNELYWPLWRSRSSIFARKK